MFADDRAPAGATIVQTVLRGATWSKPVKRRNASGTVKPPSASWKCSKRNTSVRLTAIPVPLSVWTSSVPALALHPRTEPARGVVGVVRTRRQLAVAAFRRQPAFDVVLLGRGRTEVARRDVHDSIRDAEAADELPLDLQDAFELVPRVARHRSTRTSRPCRTGARGRCRACPCRTCRLRAGSTSSSPRNAAGNWSGVRISSRWSAESATSLVPVRNSSPSSTSYTWARSVGKNPASSIVRSRTSVGVITGTNSCSAIVCIA